MPLPLSPKGRRYGAFKSKHDARDFGIARLALPRSLPSAIDLTEWCGPVRDQGDLGACTAFAGTAMAEFLWRRYKNRELVFSPLFLYYQERSLDGDLTAGDTGSTGRTCVTALARSGVCLEPSDPYDASIFRNPPSAAATQEALEYRSGAYHNLGHSVQDMKACLASGYGFIVGFTVYESFESDVVAASGLMPVPDKSRESALGGHEVFFMGYDDAVECPVAAGALRAASPVAPWRGPEFPRAAFGGASPGAISWGALPPDAGSVGARSPDAAFRDADSADAQFSGAESPGDKPVRAGFPGTPVRDVELARTRFSGVDSTAAKSVGAFKVQNSWGTGWGQSGYFWFPYDCAADPGILMDAFIQHFAKPW